MWKEEDENGRERVRERRNFHRYFGNLIFRKEIRNRGTTTERGYNGIYKRYDVIYYSGGECILYIMYTVFPGLARDR